MNRISTTSIAKAAGLAASLMGGAALAQSTQVIFYEDFEGAVLEDSVDESTGDVTSPYANFWTDTPPAGWSIDDSGVPFLGDPDEGVEEWEGWAFTDLLLWNEACGDGRGGFADLASGTVAVADGDEWDDKGNPESGGPMVTLLKTPAVNVSADAGGSVTLNFDSSWRQESPQIIWIEASFDGGAPVRFVEWTWDDSQPAVGAGGSGSQIGFKDDHPNGESQSISISVPGGASTMELTFGYSGVNDWWWAIDNVEIAGNGGQYLFEDFESLVLEDSVDELIGAPDPMVWTDELAGWTFDDSGFDPATLSDPAVGVEEWEGWAVANGAWWQDVAGDQNRSDFTVDAGALSSGNLLVADPDEWDDKGGPAPEGDEFNGNVSSPVFPIDGVAAGTIALNFYSSWRDEDVQRAIVSVSYDGGAFTEVLNWSSNPADPEVVPNGSGNQFGFKNDATNEIISLALDNPANASFMQIRFDMPIAGNDWWWAVDDVLVTGETGSAATNIPAPFFIDVPSHSLDLMPTLSYGSGLEGMVSPDSVVAGAESFSVIVAKDAGFTDVRYETITTDAPFTFPAGALTSGVYYAKVTANNAIGSRDSSNVARFAVTATCSPADINNDGIFDLNDISAFVGGFTTACP